jgi:hypothetical protein
MLGGSSPAWCRYLPFIVGLSTCSIGATAKDSCIATFGIEVLRNEAREVDKNGKPGKLSNTDQKTQIFEKSSPSRPARTLWCISDRGITYAEDRGKPDAIIAFLPFGAEPVKLSKTLPNGLPVEMTGSAKKYDGAYTIYWKWTIAVKTPTEPQVLQSMTNELFMEVELTDATCRLNSYKRSLVMTGSRRGNRFLETTETTDTSKMECELLSD